MMKLPYVSLVLLVLSSSFNSVEAGDVENNYNRIHLNANASAEIENDIMVAVVYAQEEGGRVDVLSDRVNKRISKALDKVKKHQKIKHQTNRYSSDPVYMKNKISSWRVKQSLRLESQDMALMSKLLGELQNDVALQSIQFSVSEASKNELDERLIDQALDNFKRRASQVVKNMARKSYKIVHINVSTSGLPRVRAQSYMRGASVEMLQTAPAISAGEKKLTVTVDGTIELE